MAITYKSVSGFAFSNQVEFVPFIFTPSATQSIVAGTGITSAMINANSLIRIQGSGGAVTVTATPAVAAGIDGRIVILHGDSDANTVQLDDDLTPPGGSTLKLNGGANVVLGKGDILALVYDAGDSKWYELFRSNN